MTRVMLPASELIFCASGEYSSDYILREMR